MVFDTDNFNLNGDLVATSKVTVFFDRIVYDNNSVEIADWVSVEGCGNGITYHREAMGFGDVKFMAAIGAFLGWQATVFSLMFSAVMGAIVGTLIMAIRKDNANVIPYGPYIALAAVIWMFGGYQLWDWWWGRLSPTG